MAPCLLLSVVNSFPRHDVVKFDEGTFLQWKQQVRFIVNGYDLFGFLDGSIAVPSRFVQAPDGALVVNPVASTTALEMFATDSDQRQFQLRHELHSLKKGSMSIRDYVAKLKHVCALLESSGTSISMAERTAVLLAGLPSEFEGVVLSASLSPTLLPFPRLIDALLECETRHAQSSQEVLYAANLVEDVSTDGSSRGGRSGARGRMRTFRPRL
ncbi:uncharacterized protein LOC105761996 [Gossypium raimondii]|uniref:uncharacterized protein LOC105761996 n=1 Tax=Gossypium raimondii TaxID=29730 RepID=UPI00227B209B|nr:uncharacterized protein LOC105761996 [Gossypium raimondii]